MAILLAPWCNVHPGVRATEMCLRYQGAILSINGMVGIPEKSVQMRERSIRHLMNSVVVYSPPEPNPAETLAVVLDFLEDGVED